LPNPSFPDQATGAAWNDHRRSPASHVGLWR
jgi:hypothetical protein